MKKGKKVFGIFNVLDLVIILLVIALGAGAYYKLRVSNKTAKNVALNPVSYTVEIKKVRNYAFENIREGDTLFDKTSGNAIGTIQKVEYATAKEELNKADGTMVMAEIEGRYDVLLTVDAEAAVSESGVFVNKVYELVCNSNKKFATKYFEAQGRVRDIYVDEKAGSTGAGL